MKYFSFDKDGYLSARYDSNINSEIPASAVEVSQELYDETLSRKDCMWKISEGGEIFPEIIEYKVDDQQVENSRLRAYSDSLTGSDRFLMEALVLKLQGGKQEDIDVLNNKAIKRREEIKAEFPKNNKDSV